MLNYARWIIKVVFYRRASISTLHAEDLHGTTEVKGKGYSELSRASEDVRLLGSIAQFEHFII